MGMRASEDDERVRIQADFNGQIYVSAAGALEFHSVAPIMWHLRRIYVAGPKFCVHRPYGTLTLWHIDLTEHRPYVVLTMVEHSSNGTLTIQNIDHAAH